MTKIKNKFLTIQPDITANEIAVNSLLFYLIPELIFKIFSSLVIIKYLSTYFNETELLLLAAVLGGIVLVTRVLVIINIIVILDKDYKENYTTSSKILYFILMFIPLVIPANLVAIFITKKNPNLKYSPIFIGSFVLIFIALFSLNYFLPETLDDRIEQNTTPTIHKLQGK